MKSLILSLVFLSLAGSATAQKLSLEVLSAYLTSLRVVEGQFTQTNSDGSTSEGTIYIKRPGRVRFEYAPPEEAMVIAGGGQLAIFDPRAGDPARYPLNQTPLHLILRNDVDLTDAKMIVSHGFEGTSTTIVAQDPDHPDRGSIKLYFGGDPLVLRQWVITDNAGDQTRMQLTKLRIGGRVPNRLFNIQAEMRDWNP